jgi:hypothetical protein
VGTRCDEVVRGLNELNKKQDELEGQIRKGIKLNTELSDSIVAKKDEINALNHQKEYYARLIENELLIREELQLSEAKLNGLLDKKLKEI